MFIQTGPKLNAVLRCVEKQLLPLCCTMIHAYVVGSEL